jgi:hypothetical protein
MASDPPTADPASSQARPPAEGGWCGISPAQDLLDEWSRPDFRDLFGQFCCRATRLDVAVARIRLGGLDLQPSELSGVERIRVVLSEVNAVRLAGEADAALADPGKRQNVEVLRRLFQSARLELRAAPLAGWAPDFSVFTVGREADAALVGPHWFQRPYPHPGPAFASVHRGSGAAAAARRFQGLWESAHDIGPAIQAILESAARRGGSGVDDTRLG